MIGPITNDKISSQQAERGGNDRKLENEGRGRPLETQTSETPPPVTTDDRVDVSETGQILSRANNSGNPVTIETADQARELASRIKQQMTQSDGQSLGVYGNIDSSRIIGLLASAA